MLYKAAKLSSNLFDSPQMASTREGFGSGVVEAGTADPRIVVLTADLSESTQAHHFPQKKFPDRFVQVGVAEQNLATVAAGMANYGKIPFSPRTLRLAPAEIGNKFARRLHSTICMQSFAACTQVFLWALTAPRTKHSKTSHSCGHSPIWWLCIRATQKRGAKQRLRQPIQGRYTCDLRGKKHPS